MVFVYHLIHILQRNTKDSDEYLIDIDAYLRAANAELAKTPVSSPLF